MRIIHAVILIVVLVAGGWMGYSWGSGNLSKVKAELASVTQAAETAKQETDKAKQDMQDRLAKLDAEYQEKVKGLADSHAAQKKELETQLANVTARSAEVEGKLQSLDTERQQVRKDLESAPESMRALLEQKDKELARLAKQLQGQAKSLACLTMNVPDEEVRVLNLAKSL